MKSQNYFDILGIRPTKDENIIKKAYRKKAFKYHPDRNPSKEAEGKFIEVYEAYDKLMNAIAKDKKKQSTEEEFSTSVPERERGLGNMEERLRNARIRYEKIKQREAQEREYYFNKIMSGKRWLAFKIIIIASLLLSISLTLDYLVFPVKTELNTVKKHNPDLIFSGFKYDYVTPIILNTGEKLWVPVHLDKDPYNQHFYVERTFLFKDIKTVYYFNRNEWDFFKPEYSLIIIFPLIEIVLLLPFFTYLFRRRNVQFAIFFNISLYFIPVAMLVILLSNNRLLNLFSFS